jgi:hypothetical protein
VGEAVPKDGAVPKGSAEARRPAAGSLRASGAETVTAKHVEAELNRLEAELK